MRQTVMRPQVVNMGTGRGGGEGRRRSRGFMQSYSICLSCPCRHLLAQLMLFSLVCSTNGVASTTNCFRPRFDLVGCKSRLLVADAENVKSRDDGRKQSNDESLLAGPIPILFNLGKKAIGGMMNFSVPQSDLWVDQEKRRKRIQDKLYWACRKGRTGKMMEMIGQGADVNKRDSLPMVNFTPLIYASAFGKVDAVKLLMNHQVDVNAQGNEGSFLPVLASYEAYRLEPVDSIALGCAWGEAGAC